MHARFGSVGLVLALALCTAASSVAGTIQGRLSRRLLAGQDSAVLVLMNAPRGSAPEGPVGGPEYRRRVAAAQEDCLEFLATRSSSILSRNAGEAPAVDGAEALPGVRRFWLVNALALKASPALIRELAERADVAGVVEDEEVRLPEEPARAGPPGREAGAFTYGLTRLKVPEVRAQHNLTGKGVRVGILDTGIDASHPDLTGRVAGFKDFVAHKTTPYDDNGHGSHCAGIIAGGNASGQSIGVAPGAVLLVAKIFDESGKTETSRILAALQWMVDPDGNPATADQVAVCSNSWGGTNTPEVYVDALVTLSRMGTFPCFAVGNRGPRPGSAEFPGSLPQAFAVGATDQTDTITGFSSRGPVSYGGATLVKPDVCAPGKAVYSVKAGGGYIEHNGTSMAAPHVSGVIALLREASPGLTVDQIRQLLERSAVDLGEPGKDSTHGAGRVDALSAVNLLKAGARLSGNLVDAATGAGLEGEVAALESGLIVRSAPRTGAFSFHLAPGRHTLRARAFGYVESPATVLELAVDQEQKVTVRLTKGGEATIEGRVTDAATASPLAATVTLPGTPIAAVKTQADGSYQLKVPAGTYTVHASATGHSGLVREGVVAVAGQPVRCDFALAVLPEILVVVDDNGQGLEKPLIQSLTALGRRHEVARPTAQLKLSAAYLAQFHIVLWIAGVRADRPEEVHRDALRTFVSAGGRLFVTGQNVAQGMADYDPGFMRDVLKVGFVAGEITTRNVRSYVSSLAFRIAGGTGANNQSSPDAVESVGPGQGLFRYDGTARLAALSTASGRGRVVFLGFGFEAIDTEEHRNAVLELALLSLGTTMRDLVDHAAALEDAACHDRALTPALESFEGSLVERLQASADADLGAVAHAAMPPGVRRLVRARISASAARVLPR